MFYTYILWSDSLRKYYTGHTADLKTRLDYHNAGNVKFTSKGVPWRLVYSEEHQTKSDAMIRENQIKRWKSAAAIRQLIDAQQR